MRSGFMSWAVCGAIISGICTVLVVPSSKGSNSTLTVC